VNPLSHQMRPRILLHHQQLHLQRRPSTIKSLPRPMTTFGLPQLLLPLNTRLSHPSICTPTHGM
jgi:hypothetical protein